MVGKCQRRDARFFLPPLERERAAAASVTEARAASAAALRWRSTSFCSALCLRPCNAAKPMQQPTSKVNSQSMPASRAVYIMPIVAKAARMEELAFKLKHPIS